MQLFLQYGREAGDDWKWQDLSLPGHERWSLAIGHDNLLCGVVIALAVQVLLTLCGSLQPRPWMCSLLSFVVSFTGGAAAAFTF